jgi:hypothetical protein
MTKLLKEETVITSTFHGAPARRARRVSETPAD